MKQIYFSDIYEKNTVRHLFKLIDRRPSEDLVVFDVGSNIGFYSLTLSKKLQATHSQIHAFEPNPHTYGILENNVRFNACTNVKLNQTGLSDKAGKLTISYDYKNLGAANVFNGKGKNTAEIILTTLDAYCTEHNIRKIDIIKVDIEGSEFNFLKGGADVIKRSENLVVIMEIVEENCVRAGYSSRDIFDFMASNGFKAYDVAFGNPEYVRQAPLSMRTLLELYFELRKRGFSVPERKPRTILDMLNVFDRAFHNHPCFGGPRSITVGDVDTTGPDLIMNWVVGHPGISIGVMATRAQQHATDHHITVDLTYGVIDKCILKALHG